MLFKRRKYRRRTIIRISVPEAIKKTAAVDSLQRIYSRAASCENDTMTTNNGDSSGNGVATEKGEKKEEK